MLRTTFSFEVLWLTGSEHRILSHLKKCSCHIAIFVLGPVFWAINLAIRTLLSAFIATLYFQWNRTLPLTKCHTLFRKFNTLGFS